MAVDSESWVIYHPLHLRLLPLVTVTLLLPFLLSTALFSALKNLSSLPWAIITFTSKIFDKLSTIWTISFMSINPFSVSFAFVTFSWDVLTLRTMRIVLLFKAIISFSIQHRWSRESEESFHLLFRSPRGQPSTDVCALESFRLRFSHLL